MPILILINVQYLQNVVFSFEKGSSGSHHLIKKSPQQNPWDEPLLGKETKIQGSNERKYLESQKKVPKGP